MCASFCALKFRQAKVLGLKPMQTRGEVGGSPIVVLGTLLTFKYKEINGALIGGWDRSLIKDPA